MDVKTIRESIGLTQTELAELTGIPRDRIAKWEQGKGNPKSYDAELLSNIAKRVKDIEDHFLDIIDTQSVVSLLKFGIAIKKKRESEDLSQNELAEKFGIKPIELQLIEKGLFDSTTRNLDKVLEWAEIDKDDLPELQVVGKTSQEDGIGTAYLKRRLDLKNRNIDITIPFYDIEAIAGTEYGADMTAITRPTSTIDIGDLLRDSRAALRVYGNSMIPGYPPGCVVGLVEKPDRYIHPGHVYVIETGNNRYVKRLYYSDDQKKYVCVSDNTQIYEQGPMKGKYFYPLFEIPIDQVSRIFDVTGVVKRNSNTIIINE